MRQHSWLLCYATHDIKGSIPNGCLARYCFLSYRMELLGMPGMGGLPADPNKPRVDTSEHIIISSIALLKMLKHGKSGIPVEVMGLMLGEYVDEYTINVSDVFAMPQTGSGVSVEAVDAVYQQKMVEMLEQVAASGIVVGWYHSHPGFGCWLSGVDINTQQAMEKQEPRSVAVVIDPVRSASGQVVIDAFRTIPGMGTGRDGRQVTANDGHIVPPSLVARSHGLGNLFYSLPISFKKNEHEERTLARLNVLQRSTGLQLLPSAPRCTSLLTSSLKSLGGMISAEGKKEKGPKTGYTNYRRILSDESDRLLFDGARQCMSLLASATILGKIK